MCIVLRACALSTYAFELNAVTATKTFLVFFFNLFNCITDQQNDLPLTGQIMAPFLLLRLRPGISFQPFRNVLILNRPPKLIPTTSLGAITGTETRFLMEPGFLLKA